MRFLFISEDFAACSLAYRLQELEGHEVRAFSEKAEGKEHLQGIVEHVGSVKAGLDWVGRDGYVIRDDENDVTELRRAGFRVYGGNKLTERVEKDRVFQSKLAQELGVAIPNFHAVKSVEEAIAYVKSHPDAWCLKQIGHAPKGWSFTGKDDTGEDVLLQLAWIKQHPLFKKMGDCPFMLQERVDGLEFAVGAFWLGHDWARCEDGSVFIELNREFKKMLNEDLGPSTGEMGTVMRFTDNTKLFDMMLEPLTPWLAEHCSDIILNIDANCGVVSEDEAWLYEWTPRFGFPAHALQEQLLDMESGEFYANIIDRQQGNIRYKDGWCVGTVIGANDFPHESVEDVKDTFKNQPVNADWDEHVLPEYIKYDAKDGVYRIADDYTWVATVSFVDDDIAKANEQCVEAMKAIDVRAPVFRTDVGKVFAEDELLKLEAMGYVNAGVTA